MAEAAGNEPRWTEDIELARIGQRYGLAMLVILLVLGPLGLALDLVACVPVARVLAGKTTSVQLTFAFAFTVSVSLALGITGFFTRRRALLAERERDRLRERSLRIEAERDRYKEEAERLRGG